MLEAADGVIAAYNAVSATYDELYVSRRCAAENRALSYYLAQTIREARHVLDVGCGTGSALDLTCGMPGKVYTGVDISPKMLRRACQKHPDKTFKMADISNLPFASGSFDCGVSLFAWGYVRHPVFAAAEFARVLRPGAPVFIVTFAPAWWYSAIQRMQMTNLHAPASPCTAWLLRNRFKRYFIGIDVFSLSLAPMWVPDRMAALLIDVERPARRILADAGLYICMTAIRM